MHRNPGYPLPEAERPRFVGLPTFMRLPYAESASGSRVAVLGVPFDGGTTFRPGARFGPAALREASATLYAHHPGHRRDIFEHSAAVDVGDVAVAPANALQAVERTAQAVGAIADAGAFALVLGGDHSVTLGELRALREHHGPMALVQFDAHTDLWEGLWGERHSHATFHRRAIEEGLVDPAHSLIVGLRGSVDCARDARLHETFGVRAITSYDFLTAGADSTARAIRRRVGARACFISFDIDVVDPAFAPGTGTPEAGGPPSWQLLQTLRRLTGLRPVGADVVEVCPAYDTAGITALLGATVAYELLALRSLSSTENPPEGPPPEANGEGESACGRSTARGSPT